MGRPLAIVFAALLALVAVLACWWASSESPLAPAHEGAPSPAVAAPVAASGRAASEPDRASSAAEAQAPEPVRAAAETSVDRRLRVRVVDADRQPIEKATVESFEDSTPGVTVTDRDGYAQLPGQVRGDARRLPVRAGNRHLQAFWQFREDLTITLKWAGPLQGRILDQATGTAVPAVVVTRPHSYCKHCEKDRTIADANGVFELPTVPRDEDCVLVFSADGYARQHDRLRLGGKGEPLTQTFSLRRGVVVAGRCVDVLTRQPLGGTRVSTGGENLVESNADGSFRVLVLPDEDGSVRLKMEHAGYCCATYAVVMPQPDSTIEYPLPRGATITGRVVTPSGLPVTAARVRPIINESDAAVHGMPAGARVEDEEERRPATSDTAGGFVLTGLVPGGKYQLRAGHPDFDWPKDGPWGVVAECSEGAPPAVIVLVPKQPTNGLGTIVGTYRCNGRPTAGKLEWRWETRSGNAAIDDVGNFRCEKVPAGIVNIVVTPSVFEHAAGATVDSLRWRGSVEVVDTREARLDVSHEFAEGAITGRVTLADGTAVPGRTVWAREESRARPSARSADDGTYTLRLPQAFVRVTLNCDGAASSRDASPGATGCDFIVPRRGKLRVRIRHDDGTPAMDAQVATISNDGQVRPSHIGQTPDADGVVAIELDEGAHNFLFVDQGYSPCVRAVNFGGDTSIDVTLLRGVDVTVRLHVGADPAPDGFSIRVVDEALANCSGLEWAMLWRMDSRVVDPTREGVRVRSLAPGTHRLVARNPDIEIEPSTFVVGATPVTVDVKWRRRAK